MPLIIKKSNIKKLIKELRNKYVVIDAREKSILPVAKTHLYPVKQNLLSSDSKTENTIIFGLNPAGMQAVVILDEVMKKPQPDFFYFQKRRKTILIGLQKIDSQKYKILALSNKAKNLIKKIKFIRDNKKIKIKKSKKTKLEKLLLNAELLSDVIAWSYNHKIWDKLGKKCLGCGNCSYVCPLCYCFFVEDRISLNNQCSRCRIWDSCTLPGFSEVAGNHDFHPNIKTRYYNWFYHKFVRAYKEYGRSLCVACHRCQEICPAGIDIEKILLKLIKDYKNEKSI